LYLANGEMKSTVHDFVMSLGQRVELNDSKKYNLKFFVQKDQQSWGTGDANINYAEKINIGIVSSDDANKDYTYYTTYTLPTTGEWTEVNVTFDLPAIIAENPGKSFAKAAIFVSLVPMQYNAEDKTMKHQVNLDDFSLTEEPDSEVPVTSVSLNKTTTTIPQYQMETLVASILPADASNKDLSWSSSNDAVASVDDSGNV